MKAVEGNGRHKEVEYWGFGIFNSLQDNFSVKMKKFEGKPLPDLENGIEDAQIACLVLKVSLCLFKCAYKDKKKESEEYRNLLLAMVNIMEPHFRFEFDISLLNLVD